MADAQTLASLDHLAHRAMQGDGRAEAALFEELRVRFLTLAKRRVQPDHVEDVVHDALGIVLRKYREPDRVSGILVWSLTVLRNVIGNHYQSRRRDTERTTQVEDWRTVPEAAVALDPVADMAADQASDRLEEAVGRLAAASERCGAIFRRILDVLAAGGEPQEAGRLAFARIREDFPDMSRNTFYVALHRCRAQLRTVLDRMEADHG
ncbi:MAG TPA: hypothetical protein PLH84_15255 [Candidatus Krumholzibacteria bacterium]|nr:hypothetical protein [Candidatus Krumholzibacteria bacterium]